MPHPRDQDDELTVHNLVDDAVGLDSRGPHAGLGLTPYRAPLDVRRVGGSLAGDHTPLMLGTRPGPSSSKPSKKPRI
jgi:hypothetical protein